MVNDKNPTKYIVIILMFISLFVLLALISIFLTNRRVSKISVLPSIQFWSPSKEVGYCQGYQFPPSSSNSLGIPTFNSQVVDNITPSQTAFNCIWQDQLNEQQYFRTCLSEKCNGMDGNEYSKGELEYYYDYCSTTTSRCSGNLGVIVINYTSGTPMCITSISVIGNSIPVLLSELNYYDSNQFVVQQTLSDKSPICLYYQRSSGFILQWLQNSLYYVPLSNTNNNGYNWLRVPPMNFTVDNVRVSSPAQIGYVGLIPIKVISSYDFNNEEDIRNFIIINNIMMLNYQSNSFILKEWYYSRNTTTSITSFIETYQIGRIVSIQ